MKKTFVVTSIAVLFILCLLAVYTVTKKTEPAGINSGEHIPTKLTGSIMRDGFEITGITDEGYEITLTDLRITMPEYLIIEDKNGRELRIPWDVVFNELWNKYKKYRQE